MKSAYVAGPMRGLTLLNFPAFMLAARVLREAGLYVINPAEMDLAEGINPLFNPEVEADMRDALTRDAAAVCRVDAVFMLPGWEKSRGTYVEGVIALELGLHLFEIIHLTEDFLAFRSVNHKEFHERTRKMREPRPMPQVSQQRCVCSVRRRLWQMLQHHMRSLRTAWSLWRTKSITITAKEINVIHPIGGGYGVQTSTHSVSVTRVVREVGLRDRSPLRLLVAGSQLP